MASTAVTPGGTSTVPPAGPLAIQVTWPNAGTALLPEAGASIKVTVDGTDLSPVGSSPGIRTFALPAEASQVQIQATFSATLGPVAALSAPRMTAVVLDATQTYSVEGRHLKAQSIDDYGGPHPLFTIRSTTAQQVTVVVRTEFVDVSAFWAKFASAWDYYVAEHKAATTPTTTYVLGFTGGAPLIWLAIVPNAMATFTRPFTSCLVFYRPRNDPYARLDEVHDKRHAISRYFLAPKPDSDTTARYWERDHITPEGNNLMRCQFEQAIAESQRALVMLHPWPSDTWFGVAQTAALPWASQLALRFLWSQGAICKSVAGVQLGRLGISGFSRGGVALWASLVANMKTVREVYAFDCTGTDSNIEAIYQWFQSGDTNLLRLINGAYSFDTYAKLQKRLDPRRTSKRITVVPQSATEYAPGNNSAWEHYISMRPNLANDNNYMDTLHQWSICGGEMMGDKTFPYDCDTVVTYFHQALIASGFQRLSG